MAKSTIVIPVSGDSSHIMNVLSIQDSISQFLAELCIIIVFDKKKSPKSNANFKSLTKNLYPDTRIITGEFKTVGDVRNAAISEISTQWFSFCDADDLLIPANYLHLISDAEKINADLALGSYIFKETGKDPQKLLEVEDSLNWKSVARNPGIWRYIFKTTAFSDVRFPSLNMAEDQIYLSKVYSANPKLKISALPIYEYLKQASGSLTSTPSEIKKITSALDISLNLKYSKVNEYKRIQRAYVTTQFLTSIKSVPLLRKPHYIYKLVLHLLHDNISNTLSSLSFLVYCLWRKR